MNKPLARLIGKKKKTLITDIGNERGDITTNSVLIKRIIKKYYQ